MKIRMASTMGGLLMAGLALTSIAAQSGNVGLFTSTADVGNPAIKGATAYDAGTKQYRITGAGANVWAKDDQFQYVWKEMTGNFAVSATLQFVGQGADHRKGGIMVRQSLDNDATYADVVVHGVGMPSLQWRPRKGEDTNTFDLPQQTPGTFRIKLVRNGVKMFMYVGRPGAEPKEIVHTEVTFTGPVLVGLAVCSHDAAKPETVVFSDVSIEALAAAAPTAAAPRPAATPAAGAPRGQ
jgi:TolB protein